MFRNNLEEPGLDLPVEIQHPSPSISSAPSDKPPTSSLYARTHITAGSLPFCSRSYKLALSD